MKHPSHPHHILIIAAPLWAVTLLCLAQNPSTVAVQTTEAAATAPTNLHATGNIRSMDASSLALINDLGSMTVYLTNANTTFVNKQGQIIAPADLKQQTPVTVYYTRTGNSLLATKVAVSDTLFSNGILTQVSPSELVIQMAGAPAASMHYLSSPITRFVDQKGNPMQALAVGDPVRIFYVRAGDTLVARKVQVLGPNGSGMPQAAVKTQTTTTTVTREVK